MKPDYTLGGDILSIVIHQMPPNVIGQLNYKWGSIKIPTSASDS